MRATWLVDQLRAHGAKTTTHNANWAQVGGELSGIRGWFLHHTASGPSSDGAPDINYIWSSGSLVPEYNAYCQRSGLITVGCGGRANHAGKGGDTGGSDRGRKPIPWIPANSANSYTVCLALANNGVGEPYTDAQMDAALKFCRAVNAGSGAPNSQGLAHLEWTQRKIDPAGESRWANGADMWNMDAFRASVGGSTPAPGPGPITPGEDDDMAYGPYLIQDTNGSGVYACDRQYMTLRKLRDEQALAGYRWQLRNAGAKSAYANELEDGGQIMAVADLNAFGIIIG